MHIRKTMATSIESKSNKTTKMNTERCWFFELNEPPPLKFLIGGTKELSLKLLRRNSATTTKKTKQTLQIGKNPFKSQMHTSTISRFPHISVSKYNLILRKKKSQADLLKTLTVKLKSTLKTNKNIYSACSKQWIQ